MRKRLVATIIMCVMCIGGCRNTASRSEAVPLEYEVPKDDSFESRYTDTLKTTEGIEFKCSEKYMMGPEAKGQYCFSLTQAETEECLNENYDWSMEFSCNKKISEVEYYGYDGELLGSEKVDTRELVIEMDYNQEYIDKFIVYIKNGRNMYSAQFERSGM